MTTDGSTLRLAAFALCGIRVGSARLRAGEGVPDTIAARVKACTARHGAGGQGTDDVYFPRLARKPAGDLFTQLTAFRSGSRRYPPMNYLLEYMPEDYFRQIAEHFASQGRPLPPPAIPVVSTAIVSHGEALVTRGDIERGVPACATSPWLRVYRDGSPG